MSQKHIFPIFLEGAVYNQTTATGTLPVNTSYITITQANETTATLPDGTIPGQLLTILSLGNGQKTITITNGLSTGSDSIVFAQSAPGQAVLLMWTGSKWATLTAEGAGSAA
jgi:hypothetical protein